MPATRYCAVHLCSEDAANVKLPWHQVCCSLGSHLTYSELCQGQITAAALSLQVLAAATSRNELAVVQAKVGHQWEPSTEEELDQLEADGIQQPQLQGHILRLQPSLQHNALIR